MQWLSQWLVRLVRPGLEISKGPLSNTYKYKLSKPALPLLLLYLYLGMVALLILILYLCWAACRNCLLRFT